MKSLVQEASSLAKAIEAAWNHAEKPQEFSVRILEYPKKNFIGLTTHSAKIAIFFEEKKTAPTHGDTKKRAPQKDHSRDQKNYQTTQQKPLQQKTDRPQNIQHEQKQRPLTPKAPQPAPVAQKPQIADKVPQWNHEHVEAARAWTQTVLGYLDQQHNSFTIAYEKLTLKVLFKQPLVGPSKESSQERRILANFSILLMTTLKKQFRTSLRGHKILFSHQ